MNEQGLVSVRQPPCLVASLLADAAVPFTAECAAAGGQPDTIVLLLNDARDGDQIAMPQAIARGADNGTTLLNAFLMTPIC